jgi:hypothetical protein
VGVIPAKTGKPSTEAPAQHIEIKVKTAGNRNLNKFMVN